MKLAQSGLLEVEREIEKAENYASAILALDPYFGYLAWSQLLSERKQLIMLFNLIAEFPSYPESYVLAWNQNYYKSKNYVKALEIIQQAYIMVKEVKDYEVLIGLNYAKNLVKVGNIEKAIELLQVEYNKRSVYVVYLYHYSRICIKCGTDVFLGSAVGALTECLRICSEQKHGFIHYWLSKAYSRLNEKILSFKEIQKSLISFGKMIENEGKSNIPLRVQTKVNELKSMLQAYQINPQILTRLKFILTNFQDSMIEEFSGLIKSVKEIDSLYGEILETEALWKFDYKNDALKNLYSHFRVTRVQMKSFFLMVKYLNQEKDFMNIKKICEKMIKKCRSPCIPVQIWLKVHLIFAKSLIRLNEIPKSILIYKCLAQVQPSPYISDLLYTRILQQATTIEDLMTASQVVSKLKQSQDSSNLNFKRVQLLNSKRNLSSLVIADDEREIQCSRIVCNESNQLIGSRTPEPLPKARFSKIPGGDNANPGFSVSVYYLFLYKIGKVSAKFNVNVDDGLFAMHDFLILHHYWMQEGIESDEKIKAKALYWMGVLYHHAERYQEAAATFRESLCMLFQLGLDDMAMKVQKALKEYSGLG